MSLSKELCLRSDSQNRQTISDCLVNKFESKDDNYRRDSFDDRFCDDLCEDILQYLSLKDKLRLQCVSKQFQRTVFKRQYELYINIMNPEKHKDYSENISRYRRISNYYYYIEEQNLHSFEALLKKCPNITTIELNGLCYDLDDNPDNLYYRCLDYIRSVLAFFSIISLFPPAMGTRPISQSYKINQVNQRIIENCNNLSEVIVMDGIYESNLKEVYRKFGVKIKGVRYFGGMRIDGSLFPNIERVKLLRLYEDPFISQLKLPKLKQFEAGILEGQDHLLQPFIDNFPTLTHLTLVFLIEDENAIYNSLKNISKLKHLIHLNIQREVKSNEIICRSLKQMANNCKNLKSFYCDFVINDKNSNKRQFFSQLKAFPALKRLNLWLNIVNNEGEDNIDVNQLFSFELFEGLSNISCLYLGFEDRTTLKYSFLTNIDINLSNLQILEISDIFDTTPEGVTQMADILSRLPRLQKIKLKFKSGVDFKPIEEQITEKCRKIRKINIKSI